MRLNSTTLGDQFLIIDMLKLKKVDKEILSILKETFLTRNIHPLASDEHLRLWIIRSLLIVSVLGFVVRVIIGFSGEEISSEFSSFLSFPIALFFGVLFLHVNNKSENTSLIVFVLTWISIVLSLYV